MSELSTVQGVLRSASDVEFIRPRREVYMQDELHDLGRAALARHSAAVAYAGWHWQAHGFSNSGRLEGTQYVYFGGDRAAVRRALEPLRAQGFELSGGGADDAAFQITINRFPPSIEKQHYSAWYSRLNALASSDVTVSDEEESLLHALLADETVSSLHDCVIAVLIKHGRVTSADFDAVLAPDAAISYQFAELALIARDWGVPGADSAVRRQATHGSWLPPAYAKESDLEILRDAARNGSRVDEFLSAVERSGMDTIAAGIDVFDKSGTAEHRNRIANEIAYTFAPNGDRREGKPIAPLLAMESDVLPDRIKLAIAHVHDRRGLRSAYALREYDLEPRDLDPPLQNPPGTDPTSYRAYATRWDSAVDGVRRRLGLPPHPGISMHSDITEDDLALLDDYLSRYRDGLRACLDDPGLDERRLAFVLAALDGNGSLTPADLGPWREEWRRLIARPGSRDVYSPGAPAIVTMHLILHRAGDDLAGTIRAAIFKNRTKWIQPWKDLITALTEPTSSDVGALRESQRADVRSSRGVHPYLIARATVDSTDAVTAAVAAHTEDSASNAPWFGMEIARHAVQYEAYSNHLWHRKSHWAGRPIDTALRLAARTDLPRAFRRDVLRALTMADTLRRPVNRYGLWVPTRAQIDEWRAKASALNDELGTD
jgi:hypothetical protein